MQVHMLCDTGAVCNCMSRTFYDRCMTSMMPIIPHKGRQNLVTVSDSALITIGKVNVKCKVGGCLLSSDFYVIDKITQDVILGVEFFECMGTLLHYKHK